METKEETKFVQVDVKLLQQILDYLMTKPYNEVNYFVDILTSKNKQPNDNVEGKN